MVSVADSDRDVLRFLWIKDVNGPLSDVVVMRFTRVVFGVSASPFLLNATISHHMERYRSTDPGFVDKFHHSIYVDDLTTGSDDVEGVYEFYMKAKLRLAEAGFNLRKFVTNSLELRRRIRSDEGMSSSDCAEHQVLRVKWDVIRDQLILDISEICHVMKDMKPTKRNAVSLATRFLTKQQFC